MREENEKLYGINASAPGWKGEEMTRVKVQALSGDMENWGVGLVPHIPASDLRTPGVGFQAETYQEISL